MKDWKGVVIAEGLSISQLSINSLFIRQRLCYRYLPYKGERDG